MAKKKKTYAEMTREERVMGVKEYKSAEPNLDKNSREYHAMFGWPKEDEKEEVENKEKK